MLSFIRDAVVKMPLLSNRNPDKDKEEWKSKGQKQTQDKEADQVLMNIVGITHNLLS